MVMVLQPKAERKLRLAESERDRALKEASKINAKFSIDIRTQFEQEQGVDNEMKRLRAQNNKRQNFCGKGTGNSLN